MAANPKKVVKVVNYTHIHKLAAATSLIAFLVIIAAGLMSEVHVVTMAYRALGVMLVVGVCSRIIVRILATYEEMSRGES